MLRRQVVRLLLVHWPQVRQQLLERHLAHHQLLTLLRYLRQSNRHHLHRTVYEVQRSIQKLVLLLRLQPHLRLLA
jgi:AraC-like DNA-binding protein